jgi:hypothetical protein
LEKQKRKRTFVLTKLDEKIGQTHTLANNIINIGKTSIIYKMLLPRVKKTSIVPCIPLIIS